MHIAEHATCPAAFDNMYYLWCQVSQLFKIGSLAYEDVKQFSCCVEEALFRLSAHRDRALTYKMEEVGISKKLKACAAFKVRVEVKKCVVQ